MTDKKLYVLSECLEKYPVVFAYLFGSYMRGTPTSSSDVDIALSVEKNLSQTERFDIRLKLSSQISAIVGNPCDVTLINDSPLQLAYEIIKHGKILFCKDREARIAVKSEILSRYLDRRYYDERRSEIILERIRSTGLQTV